MFAQSAAHAAKFSPGVYAAFLIAPICIELKTVNSCDICKQERRWAERKFLRNLCGADLLAKKEDNG